MREVVFLKKNEKKWRECELLLTNPSAIQPDRLAELFIELNDDLAYAQTNYPKSKSTIYLNGLTAEIYQALHTSKKNDVSRLWNFWLEELPILFYSAKRFFLYSLIIFTGAVFLGVISTIYDESFPRAILGDAYIDMTVENIKSGNPFGVYQQNTRTSDLFDDGKFSMFFDITLNNIKVSFLAMLSGITCGIGTVWLLFKNGIMLGTFQTMFHQHGLLAKSFLVVYIHGTIEISSIIIAGASGLMIGSSILFPGTTKRMKSLIKGGKNAVKIAVGLVPLFVIAGFLEGFVTRYADMPIFLQLIIIIASFIGIVYYFWIYPIILHQRNKNLDSI